MRFIFITVWKEMKRRFNDPVGLLTSIMIPFVIGFLMASVIGGGVGGPAIRAQLLVSDLDDSFVSQGILNALTSDQLSEMIVMEQIGLEEGRQRLNDGEGSGHLVIPEGFGEAWLNYEQTALHLTVNPSQTISPRLISEILDAFLDLGDYLHKVFGAELKIISNSLDEEGLVGVSTSELSLQISDKITGVAEYVFPPAIEVEDATPQPEGVTISFAILMFPGILVMAAFFAANGQSTNYWSEREKGTLARWVASPNPFWAFWLAQWFTAMVLTALVAAPIMVAGFYFLDINFEKFFTALAWLALTGPILFAVLTLIQVISPSSRVGGMITTLVMFPLLMAGGSFFPTETMPKWMGVIADYTPNGRVIEPLKGYFTGEYGAAGLFTDFAPLMLAGLLLILVSGFLSARKVLV